MMTLSNTITIDVNKYSTGSEVRGTYTGKLLAIKLRNSGIVNLIVDGEYYQKITVGSGNNYVINFGTEESRYIQFVQDCVRTSSYAAGFIEEVYTQSAKWTSDNETTVTDRLLVISDSIGQGLFSTNNSWDSYSMLFRRNDNLNTIIGGYGGATLQELYNDLSMVTDWITQAFSNVTGNKKILINIGTNDYAAATSAEDIRTMIDALLDHVYSLDNSFDIYLLSPFNRTGETSLLSDYRYEYSASSGARAYVSYIDGNGIIDPATQTTDGVHPTTAGQLAIYNQIKTTIL